ncbi:hypothetical protein U1Q18_003424 [Sarracenia purpurea var. burkii]
MSIASRTSKPVEKCFAFTVLNRFQRRSPPHNDGDDRNINKSARNIGALGRSVFIALESNPQSKSANPGSKNIRSSIKSSNLPQQQSGKQEEGQLSGSDVLLALQRASAKKIKMERRDYSSSSSNSEVAKNRGRAATEQEGEEAASDSSNARPICIKSDWNSRLNELEKLLQEFIDGDVTT